MGKDSVEVAIIGGSIAGAIAARTLSLEGISTIIIDKAAWPRDKACGEGLSFLGVKALKKLSIEEGVRKLPHVELCGIRLLSKNSTVLIPFREPGLCVRRLALDAFLINEALKCGAGGMFGNGVEKIIASGGSFTINADAREVQSKFLIAADGSHSLSATLLHVQQRNQSGRYGITIAMEGSFESLQPYVSILLETNCEVFLTPTSPHSLNISILAEKNEIKRLMKERSGEEFVDKGCEAVSFKGKRISLLGSGPLGFIHRPWNIANLLAAGDALETFDPRGGMGMSHAILTGELSGKALAGVIQGRVGFEEARSSYMHCQRRIALRLRAVTNLICFSTSPFARDIFMRCFQHFGLADFAGRGMERFLSPCISYRPSSLPSV